MEFLIELAEEIRFILGRRNYAVDLEAPNIVNLQYYGKNILSPDECLAIMNELDQRLGIALSSSIEVNFYIEGLFLFRINCGFTDIIYGAKVQRACATLT